MFLWHNIANDPICILFDLFYEITLPYLSIFNYDDFTPKFNGPILKWVCFYEFSIFYGYLLNNFFERASNSELRYKLA